MMTSLCARSLLALCICSSALAVNMVYDEVLWTKQFWDQAKFDNVLLYTNPSDEEPKLLEMYPSIKGTVANSLDGPNERRDPSIAPPDSISEGLGHLTGLEAIDAKVHIQPASEAAKCAVCHVLVTKVWQNATRRVAEGLFSDPDGLEGVHRQLQAPGIMHALLLQTCSEEVVDGVLSKQSILRLGDPTGTIMFFVLRERQKGGKPPTAAERKAVQSACKNLVLTSGIQMAGVVNDHLATFVRQLDKTLQRHSLATAASALSAGSSAASTGEKEQEYGEGVGEDQPPAVGGPGLAADVTASQSGSTSQAGSSSSVGGLSVEAAGSTSQAQQVASLVKEVLMKVEAADEAAWPSQAQGSSGKDEEYDDDDTADEDTDPACMDLHPMCLQWADSGECEANPNYMVGSSVQKGNCRKSCGVCVPRKKGERALAADPTMVDTKELQADHPTLAAELEDIGKPLLQAVRNLACTASQACLTEVAASAAGPGFTHIPGSQQPMQQQSTGWQLGTPFYGHAKVEKATAAEMEAAGLGHAPAEPGSLVAEVDEVLGKELQGKKLSVPGDFFIYEYIYKSSTRHFHQEGNGRITEDYHLGTFQRESVNIINAATGRAATLEERDLLPNMRGLMMQKEWPYVKQVYAGGNECILAGGRRAVRKAEARIACSPDGKLHMLVREPDFCHYIFVIYSPALCTLAPFKPTVRGLGLVEVEEEEDDDEL